MWWSTSFLSRPDIIHFKNRFTELTRSWLFWRCNWVQLLCSIIMLTWLFSRSSHQIGAHLNINYVWGKNCKNIFFISFHWIHILKILPIHVFYYPIIFAIIKWALCVSRDFPVIASPYAAVHNLTKVWTQIWAATIN